MNARPVMGARQNRKLRQMKRVRSFLIWFMQNFGPLIVFFAVKNVVGLKPAIAATIVWSIGEVAYIVGWRREKPTLFFCFSVGMTLLFGSLDLYSDNPFLFRYEAVVTNILTGLYFGSTLFVGTPLIQEFAEKASAESAQSQGSKRYLRYLTMVWAVSFFAKAFIYFCLAKSDHSIERVTMIRSVIGPVSFICLIGGERILRPVLIKGLQAMGKLPISVHVED